MFREALLSSNSDSITNPRSIRGTCSRLLIPLALWIWVSVTISRSGSHGSSRMVLGPTSSRLLPASSLFVKRVVVRGQAGGGVLLYGLPEKPELSSETNWTASHNQTVRPYARQGFFLWLNKGSRVRLAWKASCLSSIRLFLLKGGPDSEPLVPTHDAIVQGGDEEQGYTIEEDDGYRVEVLNRAGRDVVVQIQVSATSKIYDTSKALSNCSSINGSCELQLQYPITHFVILTTPNSDNVTESYLELIFVSRVVTYVVILVFMVIFIYSFYHYLGGSSGCREQAALPTQQRGAVVRNRAGSTYGTMEDGGKLGGDGGGSSSADSYDGKICVICFDGQRDCFFVPCGHCASCYECAQRILAEECRQCPICRRLIHRVRKLFNAQDYRIRERIECDEQKT